MFVMSGKVYDFLKKAVQIYLPAISTLYFALASIWGLPNPDKVSGTIAALCVFVGVCINISTKTYSALGGGTVGDIVVTTHPDSEDGTGKTFALSFDDDPLDMVDKSHVTFNIVHQTAEPKKTKVRKTVKKV